MRALPRSTILGRASSPALVTVSMPRAARRPRAVGRRLDGSIRALGVRPTNPAGRRLLKLSIGFSHASPAIPSRDHAQATRTVRLTSAVDGHVSRAHERLTG